MNKFSMIFLAACSAAVILCSCSAKDDADSSSADIAETTTAATTAEPTEEAAAPPVADRDIEPAKGTYVYDNAGILDDSAFAECNDYSEWLYENYLINAAVVTVADLGELTPEEYAANAYIDIYEGKGSGLLLLINNDTNKDILYKTGNCLNAIDSDSESEAFYWATKELVAGDYKTAILRLMQLGEMCSQTVFDNGGIFTAEEITVLEQACEGASADISVLATTNSTGIPNEEICRTYYDRRYTEEKGIMIMLDTVSATINVTSDKPLPETLAEAVASADSLAARGDYAAAVSSVISALKG